MTSNRNFFTYLCYIFFIICTLSVLGRCFGIPESMDYIKLASGLWTAVTAMIICILICRLYAACYYRAKKVWRIIAIIMTVLVSGAVIACKIYRHTQTEAVLSVIVLILFCTSVMVSCGYLAAFVSIITSAFIPLDTEEALLYNAVIWALFLWFAVFWRVYQKKNYNLKAGYITIVLLGIVSNGLYFINRTSLLLLVITILFMLFRHWKPAFLYMFCAFPALFFTVLEYVSAFDRSTAASIMNMRVVYECAPYTDIYGLGEYFYSVDRLFYIVIYIFAAAASFMMFAQKRKSIQILMCYVSVIISGIMLQINMGAGSYLLIILVYIMMASYFLQSVYAHFANAYDRKNDEASVDVSDDYIKSDDMSSEMLPVPLYAYGSNADESGCVIIHADEYKNNIDKTLIEALIRKRERAKTKKH